MLKKIILFATLLMVLPIHAGQSQKSYITNEWPDSRYTVHNDGTVTDSKTKLMWKVCSEGQQWGNGGNVAVCTNNSSTYTWEQALEQATSVNGAPKTGGVTVSYTDWRVPNIKELRSLVALDRHNPAINQTIFPNTLLGTYYWPSSPSLFGTSSPWGVNFNKGSSQFLYNGINYVRMVRSSQ